MLQKKIFLSHRSSQKAWLKEWLIPKLGKAGLDYWLDEREIDDQEPITEEVRQGIAESHLFLAWWFDRYEESDHCHFELITALAHCRAEGEHSYQRRVFFAGPETADNYAEAGILKNLFAKPLSEPPIEIELNNLVETFKRLSQKIDYDRPLGFSKIDASIYNTLIPDENFVGRSRDLLKLVGFLAPRAGSYQTVGIFGFAGEGKTQLAEEYARRFQFWYPGGIYKVNLPGDAGNWSDNEAALDEALRTIGNAILEKSEPNAVRERLRHLIATSFSAPFLWLIDGLPSGVSWEKLTDFLPRCALGTYIITSRAKIEKIKNLEIGALPEHDGKLLLEKLAPKCLNDEQKHELYIRVHGHALALNLIGHGVQYDQHEAIEEFLKPSGSLIDVLDLLAKIVGHNRQNLDSVYATILTSLFRTEQGSLARRSLSIMANLGAAPVPRNLLRSAFIPINNLEFESNITLLIQRGLVSQHDEEGVKCLKMHPLLAEVLQRATDYADNRCAGNTTPDFAENNRRTVTDFIEINTIKNDLSCVDELLNNDMERIVQNLEYYRANSISHILLRHSRYRAHIILARQRETSFPTTLSQVLYVLGEYADSRTLQEKILNICTEKYEIDHPEILTSKNNLAATLWSQGDYTGARELEEQVLKARLHSLGAEHSDTLISMTNLSATFAAQGHLADAREKDEQVLEVRRRTLGPEHPDTLKSMIALASTLRLQGFLDESLKITNETSQIINKNQGNYPSIEIASEYNLALIYYFQGKLIEARQSIEEIIKKYKQRWPENHPYMIKLINAFSLISMSQGDHSSAVNSLNKLLHISENSNTPQHQSLIIIRLEILLSDIVFRDRDIINSSRSMLLLKKNFDYLLNTLGNDRLIHFDTHIKILISMDHLTSILSNRNKHLEALYIQEITLSNCVYILQPEHPIMLTCMGNLAAILFELKRPGDLLRATALQEEVLTVRRRTLGTNHPDTRTSMNNLAITLRARGELRRALDLRTEEFELSWRIQGKEHPDTLNSLRNLAGILIKLRQDTAASDLLTRILHLLPTLPHAELRTALTTLARRLKLLPPEAP